MDKRIIIASANKFISKNLEKWVRIKWLPDIECRFISCEICEVYQSEADKIEVKIQ